MTSIVPLIATAVTVVTLIEKKSLSAEAHVAEVHDKWAEQLEQRIKQLFPDATLHRKTSLFQPGTLGAGIARALRRTTELEEEAAIHNEKVVAHYILLRRSTRTADPKLQVTSDICAEIVSRGINLSIFSSGELSSEDQKLWKWVDSGRPDIIQLDGPLGVQRLLQGFQPESLRKPILYIQAETSFWKTQQAATRYRQLRANHQSALDQQDLIDNPHCPKPYPAQEPLVRAHSMSQPAFVAFTDPSAEASIGQAIDVTSQDTVQAATSTSIAVCSAPPPQPLTDSRRAHPNASCSQATSSSYAILGSHATPDRAIQQTSTSKGAYVKGEFAKMVAANSIPECARTAASRRKYPRERYERLIASVPQPTPFPAPAHISPDTSAEKAKKRARKELTLSRDVDNHSRPAKRQRSIKSQPSATLPVREPHSRSRSPSIEIIDPPPVAFRNISRAAPSPVIASEISPEVVHTSLSEAHRSKKRVREVITLPILVSSPSPIAVHSATSPPARPSRCLSEHILPSPQTQPSNVPSPSCGKLGDNFEDFLRDTLSSPTALSLNTTALPLGGISDFLEDKLSSPTSSNVITLQNTSTYDATREILNEADTSVIVQQEGEHIVGPSDSISRGAAPSLPICACKNSSDDLFSSPQRPQEKASVDDELCEDSDDDDDLFGGDVSSDSPTETEICATHSGAENGGFQITDTSNTQSGPAPSVDIGPLVLPDRPIIHTSRSKAEEGTTYEAEGVTADCTPGIGIHSSHESGALHGNNGGDGPSVINNNGDYISSVRAPVGLTDDNFDLSTVDLFDASLFSLSDDILDPGFSFHSSHRSLDIS